MKIATWNVNSVKARLARLTEWLDHAKPDVALLQETKVEDAQFPREAVEDLGYNVATWGQKTYNGVAIMAKRPIEDVTRGLPGPGIDGGEDEEARYIEAVVDGVRVASVYVPQGTDLSGPRFPFKLAFLERLSDHLSQLLAYEEAFVVGGDYNVAPWPGDVFDPERLDGTLDYHPEERARLRRILNLGLVDAVNALKPGAGHYTYWDYQRGAWAKDHGYRIDHLILSPQAADRLRDAGIDREERAKTRPSDHVPAWCRLE